MKGIILAGGMGWLQPQDVLRHARFLGKTAYATYLRRHVEECAA